MDNCHTTTVYLYFVTAGILLRMQYCKEEKPSTGKEVALGDASYRLLPATNYILEVKAVAKRGGDIITLDDTTGMKVRQDALWQPKRFTTLPSTLDKPTLLNQTQHSIRVTWKEPLKIAPGSKQLYYEVHYGFDTSKASKCDTKNEGKLAVTHSTTVELNSLLAGMKYRIKVRVRTTKGASNWSEYLQASTEELKETSVEKMRKSLGIIQMEDAIKTLHFP